MHGSFHISHNMLREIQTMNLQKMLKLMTIAIIIIITIFITILNTSPAVDRVNNYWQLRAQLLKEEKRMAFGGDLELSVSEAQANDILMELKVQELNHAFYEPKDFLPAQNFFLASEKIRQSKVYQLIHQMPKGAALHCHDNAMVSWEYILYNITYQPNLFICEVNEELKLRFFNVPDQSCSWKLLRDVRKQDSNINRRIEFHLKMPANRSYSDFNEAIKTMKSAAVVTKSLIAYKPVYEDYFYQALKELYEDNVMYVEFRVLLSEIYDLEGNTYGPIEIARICNQVTNRFVHDYPDFIGSKLIYSTFHTENNREIIDEYLKTAKQLKYEMPDFIAGFDIVGRKDRGIELVNFVDQLLVLDEQMNWFFHAGETNWYGAATDENLIDAVLLNTTRIGHGYALLKHPKVLQLVKENDIGIEVNPISNQVLHLVNDLRNHPVSILFAGNYPIVISNDDPARWGAKGLSYDFYEAFMGMMSKHADIRALKKLAMNSIKYSSLSKQQKSDFMQKWKKSWDSFINELVTHY